MNKPLLSDVSLGDVYIRLGRLETQQVETNEHLAKVALALAELSAGLDGPTPLKSRVQRLESWRDKMLGIGLLLVLLAGAVETARWLII